MIVRSYAVSQSSIGKRTVQAIVELMRSETVLHSRSAMTSCLDVSLWNQPEAEQIWMKNAGGRWVLLIAKLLGA